LISAAVFDEQEPDNRLPVASSIFCHSPAAVGSAAADAMDATQATNTATRIFVRCIANGLSARLRPWKLEGIPIAGRRVFAPNNAVNKRRFRVPHSSKKRRIAPFSPLPRPPQIPMIVPAIGIKTG
jgi:hypothetical protein